jgi:hypothetical protein
VVAGGGPEVGDGGRESLEVAPQDGIVRNGTYGAGTSVHSYTHRDCERELSGLGDFMTKCINRTIGSFLLAAAIVAPAVVVAEAAAQEVSVRVYDSNHRDYHNWDDREDRAYRGYLTGRHRGYVEYNKQNHREQRNYWNWRHSHPD